MRKRSFLFIVSIAFMCCKSKPKAIKIPQMKLIVWDMLTADEWMKLAVSKDALVQFKKENIRYYNKIFALHKVSKEDFYSSFTFYQTHPNEMKILLDSLVAYGIRKRDTLTNNIGK